MKIEQIELIAAEPPMRMRNRLAARAEYLEQALAGLVRFVALVRA